MISYRNGDITEVASGIIVHGTNCQGVMSSGVAKAIKEKWPEVYTEYMTLFKNKKPRPKLLGKSQVVTIGDIHIFNAFTQLNYGRNGTYADVKSIQSALHNVILTNQMLGLGDNINMPLIGCGLGGLNWNSDVLPIIEELSSTHDIDFTIFEFDK
jgi:O-acetyl-ADP-ribose deacetylase (regulator of RNase III)